MDPRRDDFPEDRSAWEVILCRASMRHERVYQSLLFLRQGGAKIDWNADDCRIMLRPRFIRPDQDEDRATIWRSGGDWIHDTEEKREEFLEVALPVLSARSRVNTVHAKARDIAKEHGLDVPEKPEVTGLNTDLRENLINELTHQLKATA